MTSLRDCGAAQGSLGASLKPEGSVERGPLRPSFEPATVFNRIKKNAKRRRGKMCADQHHKADSMQPGNG